MTKEEIENAFETDFTNPGSLKSGEYLTEHVLRRARMLQDSSRFELSEVLRSWIQQRSEPRTLLAVKMAGELKLTELKSEIVALGSAIKGGECFLPFYLRLTEGALISIEGGDSNQGDAPDPKAVR